MRFPCIFQHFESGLLYLVDNVAPSATHRRYTRAQVKTSVNSSDIENVMLLLVQTLISNIDV